MSWMTKTPTAMTINQWHEVAISYDGETGSVQMNVGGNLISDNVGLLAHGPTTGPVVMGSRYYYSNENSPNDNFFLGKIACMRLWNIARDLSKMRTGTPLCTIN